MRNTTSTAATVLGTAAIALCLSILPVTTAQAMTPNVKKATDHYFYCLGLMLKDPAAHARECGPNLIPTSNSSLSTLSTGAPPPPPPPEEECEWDRKYNPS